MRIMHDIAGYLTSAGIPRAACKNRCEFFAVIRGPPQVSRALLVPCGSCGCNTQGRHRVLQPPLPRQGPGDRELERGDQILV